MALNLKSIAGFEIPLSRNVALGFEIRDLALVSDGCALDIE
jgi:hypothetical protein